MKLYKKTRAVLFIVFLGGIVLSITLYLFYGEKFSWTEAFFLEHYFGAWFPLIFIVFFIIISIFLPSTPFMALAGVLFGFKYGLFYSTVGGLFSALITFYLARFLGKDLIDGILNTHPHPKLEKLDEEMEAGGLFAVIILRITPIIPFNILNLGLGVSRVKNRDYILGTALGLVPSNILSVYFGGVISHFISLLR